MPTQGIILLFFCNNLQLFGQKQ